MQEGHAPIILALKKGHYGIADVFQQYAKPEANAVIKFKCVFWERIPELPKVSKITFFR